MLDSHRFHHSWVVRSSQVLYRQGARMPTRGKNECFLESSRRRNFHGEVASEWFGSYSLS
jgi:hypothetical protein